MPGPSVFLKAGSNAPLGCWACPPSPLWVAMQIDRHTKPVGCVATNTPPAEIRGFGNNFRSSLFTCRRSGNCLCFIRTKPPPAGFGGPIAPYHAPPPCIWGLCHWAGEPAGHLGAEFPSRRTARPASARKTSLPCPHQSHGSFRARCANAMSRCLRALHFASCLSSLSYLLLARLAIRSCQSHPGLYTRPHQPGSGLRATALARSDHSTAAEEPAPFVTLPSTSVHVIVRCGDTPIVHRPLGDRCERPKREPRLE